MTSPEFLKGLNVSTYPSREGKPIAVGDLVYYYESAKDGKFHYNEYKAKILLENNLIEIIRDIPNGTYATRVQSHRLSTNPVAHLSDMIARLKFSLEIELPNRMQELVTAILKHDPDFRLEDVVVGDNKKVVKI
jgi:hypothetical protein